MHEPQNFIFLSSGSAIGEVQVPKIWQNHFRKSHWERRQIAKILSNGSKPWISWKRSKNSNHQDFEFPYTSWRFGGIVGKITRTKIWIQSRKLNRTVLKPQTSEQSATTLPVRRELTDHPGERQVHLKGQYPALLRFSHLTCANRTHTHMGWSSMTCAVKEMSRIVWGMIFPARVFVISCCGHLPCYLHHFEAGSYHFKGICNIFEFERFMFHVTW